MRILELEMNLWSSRECMSRIHLQGSRLCLISLVQKVPKVPKSVFKPRNIEFYSFWKIQKLIPASLNFSQCLRPWMTDELERRAPHQIFIESQWPLLMQISRPTTLSTEWVEHHFPISDWTTERSKYIPSPRLNERGQHCWLFLRHFPTHTLMK